jgi:hypothetical protein
VAGEKFAEKLREMGFFDQHSGGQKRFYGRWVDGLMGRGVAGKPAKAAGGRRRICRKIAGNEIIAGEWGGQRSWAVRMKSFC